MLAMAPVRSSGGSARYFAKDNYYTDKDAADASLWFGAGAAAAGLSGAPDPDSFKAVLEGHMPDGTTVPAGVNGTRAFGSDFVFSTPKSLALLAYVGGDTRLLEANMRAVQKTMAWAERNLATARIEVAGKVQTVKTGNLIMALFEHDTNREQEPEAHVHVVVANATRTADGKWRALDNRPLWRANTLLGSIHMAELRAEVIKLGYTPELVGKYGTFEIGGIPRNVIEAFSTRRQQILDAAGRLVHQTPKSLDAVQRTTRAEKEAPADRQALYEAWAEKAQALGIDLRAIVGVAVGTGVGEGRETPSPWQRAVEGVAGVAAQARAVARYFAELVGGPIEDPLIPERMGRLNPMERAGAQAVASAIRHLSEREAAFGIQDIYGNALNFGLPVTIDGVEARVAQLESRRILVTGVGKAGEVMTTDQAIRVERQILAEVDAGRNAGKSLMASDEAGRRLQARAEIDAGFALNGGQEAAGRLVLSSHDRIVAIQGVAGAGKTTALRPLAAVLREEGREVLGLAFQNKMVADLNDAGIPSRTIASFLGSHQRLLEPGATRAQIDAAKAALANTVIVVDESSMTPNSGQLQLNRLANLLALPRLVVMGDERQLGAIEAGKPFEIMQRMGVGMAEMPENLRARSEVVKAVAAALQQHRVKDAFTALKPHMTIAPDTMDQVAVDQWMALDPETRERTGLYASGRVHKAEINRLVQEARVGAGEIGGPHLSLPVLDRVGLTNEEMRYAHVYRPGMVLEFDRRVRAQNIPAGRAEVIGHDVNKNSVTVRTADGKVREFWPRRIHPVKSEATTRLYTKRTLDLYAGDKIRWGDNDRQRGLLNATISRILSFDPQGVTVETSSGMRHVLSLGDPMLDKIDLAYALNAHMAQGVTSDHGIAVMDSRETRLANLRLALVTATRVRDSFRVVADDPDRLVRQLEQNRGDKTSALETIGAVPERATSNLGAPSAAQTARAAAWDAQATSAVESDAAKSAKPELEKKIDDGGGRSRQVDFDL